MKNNKYLLTLSLSAGIILMPLIGAYSQDKAEKKEISRTVEEKGDNKTIEIKVTVDEKGEQHITKKYSINPDQPKSGNGEVEKIEIIEFTNEGGEKINVTVDQLPDDFEWTMDSDSSGRVVKKTSDGNFVFINQVTGGDDSVKVMVYVTREDTSEFTKTYSVRVFNEGEAEQDSGKLIQKKIIVLNEGEIPGNQQNPQDVLIWNFSDDPDNKNMFNMHVGKPLINKATISEPDPKDPWQLPFIQNHVPLELKSLNYYPNPNEGEFTLLFTAASKPVIIRILDLKGNLMYEEEIGTFSGMYNKVLNCKGFGPGMYMMQIFQLGKVLNKAIRLE